MKHSILGLLYLLGVAILAMAVLTFAFPPKSYGAAVAGVDFEGVKIVFTDDPCALPEVVNLPYAATWTEKGKVVKGCWGMHPTYPIVLSYWADKTVSVIPNVALHALTEAAL
jgi:hypothetical protein